MDRERESTPGDPWLRIRVPTVGDGIYTVLKKHGHPVQVPHNGSPWLQSPFLTDQLVTALASEVEQLRAQLTRLRAAAQRGNQTLRLYHEENAALRRSLPPGTGW